MPGTSDAFQQANDPLPYPLATEIDAARHFDLHVFLISMP